MLQVLFCSLTGEQRDLYRAYLASEEVQDILNVSALFALAFPKLCAPIAGLVHVHT
jgi:hypothetical protein